MPLSYTEKLEQSIPADHLADAIESDRLLQEAASKIEKERIPFKERIAGFLASTGYRYATVNGKLVYHRTPGGRVAIQRLLKENAELCQPYIRTVVTEELNLDALRADHPDLVEQYEVWVTGHEK